MKKKPTVAFHGSTKAFDKFKAPKSSSQLNYGPGIYFTEDAHEASNYAQPQIHRNKEDIAAWDSVHKDPKHKADMKRIAKKHGLKSTLDTEHPKFKQFSDESKALEHQKVSEKLGYTPNVRKVKLTTTNAFDPHNWEHAKKVAEHVGHPFSAETDKEFSKHNKGKNKFETNHYDTMQAESLGWNPEKKHSDFYGPKANYDQRTKKLNSAIRSAGFDSIHDRESGHHVVFSPKHVKDFFSKSENSGVEVYELTKSEPLEKMSQPRLGFPGLPKVNSRPDQEVKVVSKPSQGKVHLAATEARALKVVANKRGLPNASKMKIGGSGKSAAQKLNAASSGRSGFVQTYSQNVPAAAVASNPSSKPHQMPKHLSRFLDRMERRGGNGLKGKELRSKASAQLAGKLSNKARDRIGKKTDELTVGSAAGEAGYKKTATPKKELKAIHSAIAPDNTTVEHEGLHYAMDQVQQQHGPKFKAQLVKHLVSQLHPDDVEAIRTHMTIRGYKRGHDEEVLTHARDMLVSKERRDDFSKWSEKGKNGPFQMSGSGLYGKSYDTSDMQKLDMNRLKAGWKRAVGAAKQIRPDTFSAPKGISAEPERKVAADKKSVLETYKNLKKSEDLEKGKGGDWKSEGYEIRTSKKQRPDMFSVSAHKDGRKVGEAHFVNYGSSDQISPDDVDVHESHRRKGLATAMYMHAEAATGKTITSNSGLRSPSAKKLWSQQNRPFGKSDLDKSLKDAAIGIAMGASIAAAAPTNQPHQSKPAPIELHHELKHIAMIESSGGKNKRHEMTNVGLNAGHTAAGSTGLMPITALETIKATPELRSKYSHFVNMDHSEITKTLNKNPEMETEIANHRWAHMGKVFGHDTSRKAYAWRKGISGAKNATDEQVRDHPYVQKFKALALKKSDPDDEEPTPYKARRLGSNSVHVIAGHEGRLYDAPGSAHSDFAMKRLSLDNSDKEKISETDEIHAEVYHKNPSFIRALVGHEDSSGHYAYLQTKSPGPHLDHAIHTILNDYPKVHRLEIHTQDHGSKMFSPSEYLGHRDSVAALKKSDPVRDRLEDLVWKLKKSESLEKGQNGDWEKEGYTFEHTPGRDFGDSKYHTIVAKDKDGSFAGHFDFDHVTCKALGEHINVRSATVSPLHRRIGLATEAYRRIEKITGSKIAASPGNQTDDAKALWSDPKREFGKSESLDKTMSFGHSVSGKVGGAALTKESLDKVASPKKNMTEAQLQSLKDSGWHNPDTGTEISEGEGEEHLQRLQQKKADKKVKAKLKVVPGGKETSKDSPEDWMGIFKKTEAMLASIRKSEDLRKMPSVYDGGDNVHPNTPDKSSKVVAKTKLANGLVHSVHHEEGTSDPKEMHHTLKTASGGLLASMHVTHYESEGETATVEHVAVKPQHRGKGFGRQLYNAALMHHGELKSGATVSDSAQKHWETWDKNPGVATELAERGNSVAYESERHQASDVGLKNNLKTFPKPKAKKKP